MMAAVLCLLLPGGLMVANAELSSHSMMELAALPRPVRDDLDCTGVDLSAPAIERMWQAVVAVSVNTADPALLDTSLAREHATGHDAFDRPDGDVWPVARTSIDASFANLEVTTWQRNALSRR